LQQQQQQQLPQADAVQPKGRVVGGIGVLALDNGITPARLTALLAQAREFASEWRELRGLHQSRLQGRILRLPLQEVGAGGAARVELMRCRSARMAGGVSLPVHSKARCIQALLAH
jgi:hypothetical protein